MVHIGSLSLITWPFRRLFVFCLWLVITMLVIPFCAYLVVSLVFKSDVVSLVVLLAVLAAMFAELLLTSRYVCRKTE